MANEKVAILGGKGMLGTDLFVAVKDKLDAAVYDLPEFDITNDRQLSEVVRGSDVLINCAAFTDVDGAESQTDHAYKVNAEAAGRLGVLAAEVDAWVLHVSTDFVFDGKLDRPYTEADAPGPINAYGKSKLAGERLLLQSGCRNCIIRIEWTYGLNGSNFVTRLLERAKMQKQLKVVDDQTGSPTATTQVAEVILKLVQRKPHGIFHFASEGYISRYEMARFIFKSKPMAVEVLPCRSSDFVTAAERPLNSRFGCTKIKTLLGEPIEPWQGPLESFLGKL